MRVCRERWEVKAPSHGTFQTFAKMEKENNRRRGFDWEVLCVCFKTGSHIAQHPGTPCVAKDNLELLIPPAEIADGNTICNT